MASILGTLRNDVLFSSNDASDIINGRLGLDTVSYLLAVSGVNVSLSIAGAQSTGGSGIDTLISIENITGSSFNDTLQGTAGNNVINGGLGNDFVSYSSATGSVAIDLRGGVATGAAGFDTLISIENVIGSNFRDTIFGNNFNNIISSGAGNDTIFASLGSDVIDGGVGRDTVDYSNLTGPISLGAFGVVTKSPGVIDQLNSVEVIIATSSNQDTLDLSGATAPATISITIDLSETDNNVQVNLGSGPAINLSALQFENVIGSGVADTITGNRLANNLSGNGGNDRINGGLGDDRIDGGFGNDIIAGGAGNDTLFGGGDNDFFLFGELGVANKDIIIDFSALNDTILLRNSLDNGIASSLANGIKGLTFVGGYIAGNVLSAASFFKGVGFTGAGSSAPGIYVDTTSGGAGNIFYNDSRKGGSFVIASVGAAASSLTNADFVYAL